MSQDAEYANVGRAGRGCVKLDDMVEDQGSSCGHLAVDGDILDNGNLAVGVVHMAIYVSTESLRIFGGSVAVTIEDLGRRFAGAREAGNNAASTSASLEVPTRPTSVITIRRSCVFKSSFPRTPPGALIRHVIAGHLAADTLAAHQRVVDYTAHAVLTGVDLSERHFML